MKIIKYDFNELVNKSQKTITEKENLLNYSEFLNLNFKLFKSKGIVYFIYVKEKETYELKYIGRSKGELFKTRITNHFHHKHKKTGSKIKEIKKEMASGKSVKLNFLITEPASLRTLLEAELILKNKQTLWNKQKG